MKAILISKSKPRKSKYGGMYIRCTFRNCDDNKSYLLDVYEGHPRSINFANTGLPLQGVYTNMSVLKTYGGKFIDGNSNFNFLGIKK